MFLVVRRDFEIWNQDLGAPETDATYNFQNDVNAERVVHGPCQANIAQVAWAVLHTMVADPTVRPAGRPKSRVEHAVRAWEPAVVEIGSVNLDAQPFDLLGRKEVEFDGLYGAHLLGTNARRFNRFSFLFVCFFSFSFLLFSHFDRKTHGSRRIFLFFFWCTQTSKLGQWLKPPKKNHPPKYPKISKKKMNQ